MPSFAQFVTFKDDGFTVPTPTGEHNYTIDTISPLADLDTDRDAVLEFSLLAQGNVHLTMTIKHNNFKFLDHNFRPPEPASPQVWREIIAGSRLQLQGNEIVVAVGGTGNVELSDFTLTYHAQTPG